MGQRSRSTLSATLLVAMALSSTALHARLYEPDAITVLPATKNGPAGECGIQADYQISGSIMRVELSGAPTATGVRVFIRAYMPSSVGPAMRDLWLKTTTLFTLGNFKPARDNAQGILETSGEVDKAAGANTLREIADGDAEISLIFDGVLPASRLAIGLPVPLPGEVAATLNDCASAFEKKR